MKKLKKVSSKKVVVSKLEDFEKSKINVPFFGSVEIIRCNMTM